METVNALRGAFRTFNFLPRGKLQRIDIERFFAKQITKIEKKLQKLNIPSFKYNINLQVRLKKFKVDTIEDIIITPWFPSKTRTHFNQSKSNIKECFKEILQFFDNFLECGSGWTLEEVVQLDVNLFKFAPLGGGCKSHKLPKCIQIKRACLTIDCFDNRCFLYCVLASICKPTQHPERHNQYVSLVDRLNLTGISFPVYLPQIELFESNNNLSINVYGFEKCIFPLYVTSQKFSSHINLLLYKNHFYLIRCMSRLLYGTIHRSHVKKHFCQHCLCHFGSLSALSTHLLLCQKDQQRYSMPEQGTVLKFTSLEKQYKVPFVLYCDFETMSVQCENTLSSGKTTKLFEHVPISFGVARVCSNKHFSKPPYIYRGKDCIGRFLDYIREEYSRIQSIIHVKSHPLVWNKLDQAQHKNQTNCSLCGVTFSNEFKERKCADHDHFEFNKSAVYGLSNYRSALCNTCNLKRASISEKLIIVFHNLQNYDSHLIIQEIHKSVTQNIRVIPRNSEKMMSFQFENFMFIDSYQFLNQSLETLAKNLKTKGVSRFKYAKQFFKEKYIDYLVEKGIMCYSYITSEEVFLETKLPTKEQFYDLLTESHISDENYTKAQEAWKRFRCETLGDYFDMYLKIDVCLLADVFENFRTVAHEYYGLDPARYLSLPHFSFDCALKFTKAELELFSDIDMYNFVEASIRGGICVSVQKYAKANNRYMFNYDPNKRSSYIMYLDCNNLYGHAMSQLLPYDNYHWLTDKEVSTFNIFECNPNYGYFLEVDLSYPQHLHNKHSDYPLACEKLQIELQDLSPFSQCLAANLGMTKLSGCKKLVPNLHNKVKYIAHYKNIQKYVTLGLEITHIYRILAFTEKQWLKPYIDFNTTKRQEAANAFEKDFFKLMINSVFGKTMESVKKRIDFRLVQDETQFTKLVSQPTFKSAKVFNSQMVGVTMNKPNILLNKPISQGSSILELSKVTMISFWYDFLLANYGENLQLLYTDTDSFVIRVFCDDFYRDMENNRSFFDTSNYDEDHFLRSVVNKNVPGLWKDECKGSVIKSFCSLRPKMYSYVIECCGEDKTSNKIKGIKKYVASTILHKDYVNCLKKLKESHHSFKSIRSFKHKIFTVHQSKKSLSPMDDKRWFVTVYSSLPYGHYMTLEAKRKMSATNEDDLCSSKRFCRPCKTRR